MRLARLHAPLMLAAAAMVILILVSTGGLVLDDRTLVGVPIWLKPLKFSISIAIYTATLAWMLSLVRTWVRTGWWLGTLIAAGLLLEMVVIVGQVARGRQSHFNVGTPLDAALYGAMGTTIVVVWCATAGIGLLLLRERIADRVAGRAIRLGLLVALGGLSVGYLMTRPSAEQSASMAEVDPSIVGAHGVGVPDGGPGIPLLNWSTQGGDLRAGHFVGMHALQALPLFALLLALAGRRSRRLRDERVRARLVAVAGGTYGALTVLITWQALRGQSIVAPDPLTLAVAAALLIGAALGTGWALRSTSGPLTGAGTDTNPAAPSEHPSQTAAAPSGQPSATAAAPMELSVLPAATRAATP
jgi:hypothetical protein